MSRGKSCCGFISRALAKYLYKVKLGDHPSTFLLFAFHVSKAETSCWGLFLIRSTRKSLFICPIEKLVQKLACKIVTSFAYEVVRTRLADTHDDA